MEMRIIFTPSSEGKHFEKLLHFGTRRARPAAGEEDGDC
jgi:hypothetical protein